MSNLVLRNRSRFRKRSKAGFWDSSVPPFDKAIKRLFSRVGGWAWVACIPLTIAILAIWGVAA
jgi:Amt family ammonium transporter